MYSNPAVLTLVFAFEAGAQEDIPDMWKELETKDVNSRQRQVQGGKGKGKGKLADVGEEQLGEVTYCEHTVLSYVRSHLRSERIELNTILDGSV